MDRTRRLQETWQWGVPAVPQLFSKEKPQNTAGLAGLSHLPLRIKQDPRSVKFTCAKLHWLNEAHRDRYAKCIMVARKTQASSTPMSPKAALSMPAACAAFIQHSWAGAGGGLLPTPSAMDAPMSHSHSSVCSLGRCWLTSGLCYQLCRFFHTPVCFFVPAVTRSIFSTTPFSGMEPRVWALWGAGCASAHCSHTPQILLFVNVVLCLTLSLD